MASLTSLNEMVDEDNGAVKVCVQLNHRPMDTIVTATLATQPLTAIGKNTHGAPPQVVLTVLLYICMHSECFSAEGEDFVSLNVTLVWHYDSPSLTQCVSVAIINDECVEEKEEVFTIYLSTEEECVDIGPNNQTTVTILDNDREFL